MLLGRVLRDDRPGGALVCAGGVAGPVGAIEVVPADDPDDTSHWYAECAPRAEYTDGAPWVHEPCIDSGIAYGDQPADAEFWAEGAALVPGDAYVVAVTWEPFDDDAECFVSTTTEAEFDAP